MVQVGFNQSFTDQNTKGLQETGSSPGVLGERSQTQDPAPGRAGPLESGPAVPPALQSLRRPFLLALS